MTGIHDYSDHELIKGCQKGDRRYQKMLYQKYAPLMYSTCLGYARERSIAQDILQEGFIKVFKNISHFSGTGSLKGWIRKIITNTAIDYFRKNNTLSNYIVSGAEVENEEVPNHILEQIDSEMIMGKIGELPEGARVIFNLFALEGYTHKEISDRLNISEGTSKSQLNRAKNILKKWLEEYI
jgi:RNA polymerase sigma-70 factor (ECF subfamily)